MKKSVLPVFIATLLASCVSLAQSMTIAADDSLAIDCYNRSLQAATSRDARFADIETCDKAIGSANLSARDLLSTLVNRGVIYATLGRTDRAADDYARALTIANDVPEIYLNRGNLMFLDENWGEAISDYNQAEALGLIQTHVLYLNRGMAYENSGRLAEAEADYIAALERVPNWQPALEKLQRLETRRLGQPVTPGNTR